VLLGTPLLGNTDHNHITLFVLVLGVFLFFFVGLPYKRAYLFEIITNSDPGNLVGKQAPLLGVLEGKSHQARPKADAGDASYVLRGGLGLQR
jgi:hypothetical protein